MSGVLATRARQDDAAVALEQHRWLAGLNDELLRRVEGQGYDAPRGYWVIIIEGQEWSTAAVAAAEHISGAERGRLERRVRMEESGNSKRAPS